MICAPCGASVMVRLEPAIAAIQFRFSEFSRRLGNVGLTSPGLGRTQAGPGQHQAPRLHKRRFLQTDGQRIGRHFIDSSCAPRDCRREA